jgi:hypothetical protein
MKSFYSVREAANHLTQQGIKTTFTTLNAWRSAGMGPVYKTILGEIYYTPEALANYFLKYTQTFSGGHHEV